MTIIGIAVDGNGTVGIVVPIAVAIVDTDGRSEERNGGGGGRGGGGTKSEGTDPTTEDSTNDETPEEIVAIEETHENIG